MKKPINLSKLCQEELIQTAVQAKADDNEVRVFLASVNLYRSLLVVGFDEQGLLLADWGALSAGAPRSLIDYWFTENLGVFPEKIEVFASVATFAKYDSVEYPVIDQRDNLVFATIEEDNDGIPSIVDQLSGKIALCPTDGWDDSYYAGDIICKNQDGRLLVLRIMMDPNDMDCEYLDQSGKLISLPGFECHVSACDGCLHYAPTFVDGTIDYQAQVEVKAPESQAFLDATNSLLGTKFILTDFYTNS